VAERQRAKLLAPATKEWIVGDDETAGLQSDNVCNDHIDVGCRARVQNMESQTESASCRLQIGRLNITARESRINQRSDGARVGEQLVQYLQSFPTQLGVQGGHARQVAAGPCRLVTKPT
jgi:hypothetical protein